MFNGRLMAFRTVESQYPLDVMSLIAVKWSVSSSTRMTVQSANRKWTLTFTSASVRHALVQCAPDGARAGA